MMRSFVFLWVFVAALNVSPLEAETRSAARVVPKIAMITWRGETDAERGFEEGINRSRGPVNIVRYPADQDMSKLERIIAAINQDPVSLIYVFGTTATKFVLSRIETTPVVFNVVSLPVATGIIESWPRSGNNCVGMSNKVPVHHQLKAFQLTCAFKRLGIIFNPGEQNSLAQVQQLESLSHALGYRLHAYPITKKAEIAQALADVKKTVDAVYIPADSLIKSLGREIVGVLNENKIPSMTAVESMVSDDGVLLGLVPSYYDLGIAAAKKADRILAGQAPGAIASATLDHFQFWVNMRTAEKIGIQIPLSTLIMADRIVR